MKRTFPTASAPPAVTVMARNGSTPFSEIINGFLAAKTLAPKSRVDYGRYLREFDKFAGHKSLEDTLTLDLAAQWIDQLRPRGLHSAHNACMCLKSLATWVAKARIIVIQGGGSLLTGLEAPKVPQSLRNAFNDEEVETMLTSLDYRPHRDRSRARAYIWLLLATGLRRNEARQLTREDLHLDHVRGRSWILVRAKTSKGMKERQVRLDINAVRQIDEYLEGKDQRPTYSGPKGQPEPIFLTEEGHGFTENGFGTWAGRLWDDIEKATGVKGSSHFMRHTWATNYNRTMKASGLTVYDLKREGGWADLNIPLRYTHDRPLEELLDAPTSISTLREMRTASARKTG